MVLSIEVSSKQSENAIQETPFGKVDIPEEFEIFLGLLATEKSFVNCRDATVWRTGMGR